MTKGYEGLKKNSALSNIGHYYEDSCICLTYEQHKNNKVLDHLLGRRSEMII